MFDGECLAEKSIGGDKCDRCMVTPVIIQQVNEAVDCLVVVALNDGGAELAYMIGSKIIDMIISDDENLLLSGCSKIMFGLCDDGSGLTVDLKDLHLVYTTLDLSGFSPRMF